LLRHGILTSPGTYSANTPAFYVNDISGDGPATAEATGLVEFDAPRIADSDTNAANAMIF